VFEGMNH